MSVVNAVRSIQQSLSASIMKVLIHPEARKNNANLTEEALIRVRD